MDLARTAPAALAPGGRFLFFERTGRLPDTSIELTRRRRSHGIYRLDLSDMTVARADFEPWDDSRFGHAVAGSPDGHHVVIAAKSITVATSRWSGNVQTTVWLAHFDGTAPRELLTVTGERAGLVDDSPVQWSPDGTLVATSLSVVVGLRSNPAHPDIINPDIHHRIVVLDPWTGQEVARADGPLTEGPSLVGSAFFSPDGTRLLTAAAYQPIRTWHLPSGRFDPIPALPVPHHSPPTRAHRTLGFADEDHLITVTQRGKRMNVWRMPLDGGEPLPLYQFPGDEVTFPAMAAMPPEHWLVEGVRTPAARVPHPRAVHCSPERGGMTP